jgi:hypothetical protein
MAKRKSMNPNIGGEPGTDQQASRRDREDTGRGRGTRKEGVNQGRHGSKSSSRRSTKKLSPSGRK